MTTTFSESGRFKETGYIGFIADESECIKYLHDIKINANSILHFLVNKNIKKLTVIKEEDETEDSSDYSSDDLSDNSYDNSSEENKAYCERAIKLFNKCLASLEELVESRMIENWDYVKEFDFKLNDERSKFIERNKKYLS